MNDVMNEIRCDAFKKVMSEKISEDTFELINTLLHLVDLSIKEGFLATWEEMEKFSKLQNYEELELCFHYLGNDQEDLIELLSNEYWINNPTGLDALHFYLIISTVIRMNHAKEDYLHIVKKILLSCMPIEYKREYEEFCNRNHHSN